MTNVESRWLVFDELRAWLSRRRRAVGVADWSYDIPIVFKLLVSGNPRSCRSMIFEGDDEIALVGDYRQGLDRMLRFLDRVSHPAVEELKEDAREFLEADENRSTYFVLEGYEVFCMGGEPAAENQKLLADLANLEPQMRKAIEEIDARVWEETHPPGFLARLFGARQPVRKKDSNDLVYGLGLGNWTNILFYDPGLDGTD
jgi:hypothetical protein